MAAVGYLRGDLSLSPAGQVRSVLDCAREMLEVVRCMSYPPTLGKMELRIGVHVGPVFAGVIGVKFPRYTFFGTTVRLTKALNRSTLPMTIHVSEMAYLRVKVSVLLPLARLSECHVQCDSVVRNGSFGFCTF